MEISAFIKIDELTKKNTRFRASRNKKKNTYKNVVFNKMRKIHKNGE